MLFRSGEPVPFVMELPNYRLPSAKSVVHLIWEKAKGFIESRQRVMRLFTLTDTRSRGYFYASMEDTEKQLAPAGFLRVQRSYLVNMAHIQKLNYDKVILTDGTELPVSQKMYASIKAKYLRWRNRQ